MKIKIKPPSYYLAIGFAIGFVISLAGMTFEDYMHNVSILHALGEIHHFITPVVFGIVIGFFAFIYRRNKVNQLESLYRFNENLRSHLEINQALISTIELEKVLQIIIDKSTQIINLDTGAIYLHEHDKLYLGATTPTLPENFPEVLRYDDLDNHPHIKKALATKSPCAVNDVSKEVLTDAEQIVVKARNLVSILYIPLIIENRAIGTMILGATTSKRVFTNQEIDIYNSFSGQAALAIENARLYNSSIYAANELRHQNEEFLSLNEELSENNKRIYEMNESLKVAKEKAEESERLKTAFLNNITHEIRTPLNAVVGFSNIINDSDLTIDKLKAFTQTIANSSNQLLSIVDDVLEISFIQAKSSIVVNTEFNIIHHVKQLIEDFKPNLINQDIEFKASINTNLEDYIILSDKNKIATILKHLLNNARKFTRQGAIHFKLDIDPDNIFIEIADTGIGIPNELQEIIFEPFTQVEVGKSRTYGGNGLGLAIVKANVELLNGKISLKSELYKGTSIKVTIPAKHIVKHTDKNVKGTNRHYPSKTILIAENEPSNFFYLSELLAETKAKILHALNGQEVIEIFRNENKIDIILMDLKMPIVDGQTAAKKIKGINSKIPIIAQTAYLLNKTEASENLVFDEIINKPLRKDILFDILNKYLK